MRSFKELRTVAVVDMHTNDDTTAVSKAPCSLGAISTGWSVRRPVEPNASAYLTVTTGPSLMPDVCLYFSWGIWDSSPLSFNLAIQGGRGIPRNSIFLITQWPCGRIPPLWYQGFSSFLRSRRAVPRLASSNRPSLCMIAPVNAPFSGPKSSLSKRPVGIAAQFNFTKELEQRGLRSWMARATSSFPVPVSP